MVTGEKSKPGVFEFAGFRLDAAVLRHGGAIVPLTPKAVDTLYLLVSRAPDVVSKEELIARVWPDTFVVESGLARNISVIRAALEQHGGAGPYIETIPKRGYRFVAPLQKSEAGTQPADVVETIAPPPPLHTPWWIGALGGMAVLMIILAFWRGETTRPDPAALIAQRLLEQATPVEVQRAASRFEQAIATRPGDASLHAGLADTLMALRTLGVGDRDLLIRAKAEAAMAIRLAPNLAAAHASMGAAALALDWDFSGAAASIERARQLDPRSVTAILYQVRLLSMTRRFAEASTAAEEGIRADPVSSLVGIQPGLVLYRQQRFAEAEPIFRAVLERERNFALAHYYRALTLTYLGRFDEAQQSLDKAELHPGLLRTDRAWIRLQAGAPQEAHQVLDELLELTKDKKVSPASPLLLLAAFGRLDEAYRAIDAGIETRDGDLLWLASDPRLAPLKNHPRYPEALRRIGLPSTEQPD